MRRRPSTWRGGWWALVALLLGMAGAAAARAARPGTGYDPRSRGLSQARYYACLQYLDSEGKLRPCPEVVKAIDFSVDPFVLGKAAPGFAAAFDARWGRAEAGKVPPDSGAFRRKKWSFLDNERGGLAQAALIWACQERPELLGIEPGAWTCQPLEREALDFEAAYDLPLLRAYFDAEVPGARPEAPAIVAQPGRPCTYAEPDPWWYGWTLYYRNTACGAATPPATGPGGGSPPASDGSRQTLEELRRRLRELLDWLDHQLPPPAPSTGAVTLGIVPRSPPGGPHG